jgi:tRNA-Thr(GGU) m(6)t(6)A37 methyltransferase TsaA
VQGFSHVNVLWWAHFVDEPHLREIVDCDQPYQKAPPRLGLFATRSPVRPNPIGLTVAQVLHIDQESGRVHIAYIDAEDGTPVLDIKPYVPSTDRVQNVGTPVWCEHWPQWYEESGEFDWEAEFVHAQ